MDIPIYFNLIDFQNNYKIDFEKISTHNKDYTLTEYYENLNQRYSNISARFKNAQIDLKYLEKKINDRKLSQLDNHYSKSKTEIQTENLIKQINEFNDYYKLFIDTDILGSNIQKLKNFLKDSIENTDKIINLIRFESRKETKPTQTKKSKLSNPEKIAVLYRLGIEETLNKFIVNEDKYRFIHELIGGNYDNIKKVMIAGVTNENKRVAQEFINSKTS